MRKRRLRRQPLYIRLSRELDPAHIRRTGQPSSARPAFLHLGLRYQLAASCRRLLADRGPHGMSQAVLALGLLIGLQVWLSLSASAGLVPESGFSGERQQDYGRALLLDSRERRAASSGLGPSFIRYGRNGEVPVEAVKQPHTRSDIIIRYGRDGDGLNSRLNRLRQERKRRLARLALICAAKIQEDLPANSAEEQILKEICKDAPLHPTVPDFV